MTEKQMLAVIRDAVDKAGSLRKAANEFGCSPTFLSLVLSGKMPPTSAVLRPLGYECVVAVTYRRKVR